MTKVSEGERQRCTGTVLSEVWLNRRDLLPSCLYGTLLPRILKGETNETKAGVLALFRRHAGLPSTSAQASGGDSGSLLEPSEVVTKPSEVVDRRVPEVPIGCCLGYRRHCSSNLRTRGRWRWTFHRLCEKIAEAVEYGQDLLTIDAPSQWQRHTWLSPIFIARSDPLLDFRRLATLLWKEIVQSCQKAKTEITGVPATDTSCFKTLWKTSAGCL